MSTGSQVATQLLDDAAENKRPRAKRVLVADLFCGAGGTSTGARRALADLGMRMDLLCVNHWDTAIETHKKNHPEARHYCQDVSTVRPHIVVPEGRLDLLMASPTCTFHSRARGGKPTTDQQRMDPWHVIAWLTELRVRCLIIENVPEFVQWGPVDPRTGKPLKSRKGEYFNRWVQTIRDLGFVVDWRILNAADFGDATTRSRFFLIARSDRKPLRWPEPTHAKTPTPRLFGPPLRKWRPAREVIDWSLRGKSIYARKKPLSPKTLARIYAGAVKFRWPEPFLVILRQHMAAQSVDDPMPTITAGGTHIGLATPMVVPTTHGPAVVEPFIAGCGGRAGQSPATGVEQPMGTITTKNDRVLVEPFVLSRHAGGSPRAVEEPTPCQVAKHSHLLVEAAFSIGQQSCAAPRSVEEPIATVCTAGMISLIAPFYGQGSGKMCKSTNDPLSTVIEAGGSMLASYYGTSTTPRPVDEPVPTITTKDRFGLVTPVTHADGSDRSRSVEDPLPTVTCAPRGELAFITASFGERDGQDPRVHSIEEPAPTICATGRINLVEGREYDILFRMLEPHELAAAMGFDADDIEYEFAGTKTEITKQIGNAVSVRVATALVSALMGEL